MNQNLNKFDRFLVARAQIGLKSSALPPRVVELVLDTAAHMTIVDEKVMNFLGYSKEDSLRPSRLDGAAGESKGFIVELPSFGCLGYEMQKFKVASHPLESKVEVKGLLGMDFLEHFQIDLNFSNGDVRSMQKVC